MSGQVERVIDGRQYVAPLGTDPDDLEAWTPARDDHEHTFYTLYGSLLECSTCGIKKRR